MFKIFEQFTNLKYGISTKADGAIELAAVDLSLAKNRGGFLKEQNLGNFKMISPFQSHTAFVAKVGLADVNGRLDNIDALVTQDPGLLLTITVADCFPIYFYDPKTQTVALAHSGWRGTTLNIAGETVKAMGPKAADVLVGIGPGIQVCHFEIKKDIVDRFVNYPEAIEHKENKIFVDLPKIIKTQLFEEGIKESNLENSGECTYCGRDQYFSYRRDKPEFVKAMVAYIGVQPH